MRGGGPADASHVTLHLNRQRPNASLGHRLRKPAQGLCQGRVALKHKQCQTEKVTTWHCFTEIKSP